MPDAFRELSDLLGALCDQRLTDGDRARLESLVLSDREHLQFYLRYMQLHGLLHWDVAGGTVVPLAEMPSVPAGVSEPSAAPRRILLRRWVSLAVAASLCVLAGWGWWRNAGGTSNEQSVVQVDPVSPSLDPLGPAPALPEERAVAPIPQVHLSNAPRSTGAPSDSVIAPTTSNGESAPLVAVAEGTNRSSESMVSVINRELSEYWRDHEVEPAARANDATWLRRVHLDLVGRIPEADEVIAFLADNQPDKRARVVDDLLANPEFARHASVVWTNLLIGHTSPREVNRPALEKFLREQFHRNRPWSDTVTQLVAAEGYEDENGAANFLLAHVNNEAVPATAVTARVLLCEQLQCTQCHNHPFVDWTQDRFWQLNAFFQQTEIVRHRRTDPATGQMLRDRLELVSLESGGPTYYEDRQLQMKVAYPQLEGRPVDAAPEVNRRQELAKLLVEGDQPQVARAFVNRLWGKLFGYGFTDPIDDMGPHKQPVLPELLNALSTEFVHSGYDVKQLIRWICLSEPYQLSHEPGQGGEVDDPVHGYPPLFSRMYVRPLSAEQIFDSLLTATQADRAGTRYWDEAEARRREWLEQFYQALDNDENSEEDAFEGSLAQTLVMMNGDLIRQATAPRPGTVLQQILARDASEEEQLRLISLATLSRYPTADETTALRKLLRQQVQSRPRDVAPQVAMQEGLRDLMWAYLNSTEFRSNF
jgi:hypothetical protein